MIRMLARLLPIALCALLVACPSTVRKAPEQDRGLPPIAPPDLSGAMLYKVSPQASQVDVLVFRGGTLARLGHNHVMTSRSVTGRIWIQSRLDKSGLELSFPVNELIVDDPGARRAAGDDFPPDIPQADKDGTRKNMLRAEVLDAERFPAITLRSVRVSGALPAVKIAVRIKIKEISRDVEVPASVTLDAGRLSASGEFDILQTDFGIEPFSIALGAIEVQDRLRVRFRIVAEGE